MPEGGERPILVERQKRGSAHAARKEGIEGGTPGGLSPTAWATDKDLSYDQWAQLGTRLGAIGRGSGWWIGDWLQYGAVRYGGRYKIATRVTGYDEQTLMNMSYVASRFEISRRRENLSWSHHANVAALEPTDQERWLDMASDKGMTVHQLRSAIQAEAELAGASRKPSSGARAAAAQTGEALDASPSTLEDHSKCPNCGFSL